jgi:hypothetical protein
MNFYRSITLLLIFLASVCIGYHNGITTNNSKASIDSISMPFTTPPEDQYNLLIIQVDDLEKPNVALKSVWLVVYYSDSPRVDLFPIFPFRNKESTQQISNSFTLTADKEPCQDFWKQLDAFGSWWNGYILLDEIAAAQIISFLGNENAQETLATIQDIPLWYENLNAAVQSQSQMYELALQKISQKDNYQGIISLLSILRSHSRTNLAHAKVWETWKLLRSYDHSLTGSFPTLAKAEP